MTISRITWLIAACMMLLQCAVDEPTPPAGVRIVSLSPSITATIVDIGASNLVVGRSAFCRAIDQHVPVVGDLYEIDYERLLRLNPSHVFVQKTISGIDPHLKQLAEEGNFSLHAWRIDRLQDIRSVHSDLLRILGKEPQELKMNVGQKSAQLPSPVLIMTDGSVGNAGLCFGRETYLDDLLVMMGTENVLQREGWFSLSLEDIGKLHPAVIIVVSDSFINKKRVADLSQALGIPIIPFVHEDVLTPSSKIVDVAVKLQQALSEL